ncbi:MAG: hypothetical protein OEM46_05000 [Ignavibacteria bacterium]|nr:hypothetical protein [Ignavibacteria bacterium]
MNAKYNIIQYKNVLEIVVIKSLQDKYVGDYKTQSAQQVIYYSKLRGLQ